MLTNLHVKNLALIEEADINFENGLNIITGETGAGKSIVLGSVNIALGGKASSDIIRKGCDYALTELIFHVEDEDKLNALREFDIEDLEDKDVIISRKIMPNRSQIKVNGVTTTASQVRRIASLLIDIHGQHDNQLLLKESTHLDIIDLFGEDKIMPVKRKLKSEYLKYLEIKRQLQEMDIDEEEKRRRISFLEYEINEITGAELTDGEDDELEARFRRMNNSQKILSDISSASCMLSQGEENAQNFVGIAERCVANAAVYDETLSDVTDTLSSVADLISEAVRVISDYADKCEYDEADYKYVTDRLDLINSFKLKYAKTIPGILDYCSTKQVELDEILRFDEKTNALKNKLDESCKILEKLCCELSDLRKEAAKDFCASVSNSLSELNFLNTEFDALFEKTDRYSANGFDEMHFMISTNVGEDLKPLAKVASGGELSRIMLAIKTCIAGKDKTDTLIFDEIDAGISGKTAQKVAEKLSQISRNCQIICITHLIQIAAMADSHFVIEKNVVDDSTVTTISDINNQDIIKELARLLGGSTITDTSLQNAKEMKNLAQEYKDNLQ